MINTLEKIGVDISRPIGGSQRPLIAERATDSRLHDKLVAAHMKKVEPQLRAADSRDVEVPDIAQKRGVTQKQYLRGVNYMIDRHMEVNQHNDPTIDGVNANAFAYAKEQVQISYGIYDMGQADLDVGQVVNDIQTIRRTEIQQRIVRGFGVPYQPNAEIESLYNSPDAAHRVRQAHAAMAEGTFRGIGELWTQDLQRAMTNMVAETHPHSQYRTQDYNRDLQVQATMHSGDLPDRRPTVIAPPVVRGPEW